MIRKKKIKVVITVVFLESGDDILFSRKVLRYLILQHCLSDCDKDTGYLLEWAVAASLSLSLSLFRNLIRRVLCHEAWKSCLDGSLLSLSLRLLCTNTAKSIFRDRDGNIPTHSSHHHRRPFERARLLNTMSLNVEEKENKTCWLVSFEH